jgi:hypothetical protein
MRCFALLLLVSASALAATPATTNNDDSCDIALQPAATLLLPYFEVDFKSPPESAATTLFTIQNVSRYPQIAHVVVWTDWSFPALDFNIFLTGYDVQGINLYDIFAHAVIAPGRAVSGTSSNTTVPTNRTPGSQPADNNANPNISNLSFCGNLPGLFSSQLQKELQLIFTTGKATGAAIPCTAQAGGVHSNAIGYATIDVVSSCHFNLPTEAGYFDLILYDNVLTGDYQQVVPRGAKSYALGGPLVHIRAIPEGGPAGAQVASNLPYTFYDLYTTALPNRTADRRQPLPSVFAPRFINGGENAFNASLKIWREGMAAGTCSRASSNSNLQIADIVRFDEHENAEIVSSYCNTLCLPGSPGLPTTSSISTSYSYILPPLTTSGDVGGWLYLNLNNGGSTAYSAAGGRDFRTNSSTTIGVRQSQNWVVTSMFAEPTYAVDATAIAMGNGCSPSPKAGAQVGPVP